jgi:ribosomal protein S18 acetylase RimI-like enzyme
MPPREIDDLVVRALGADEIERDGRALAGLLLDAFAGGAAMDMQAPLAESAAIAYWQGVAGEAARGEVEVLGAFVGERLVGTVQLKLAMPANQPHRAQVAKLMVGSAVRRRGIAHALMTCLHARARAHGRTLLTLETVSGSAAERLWRALGYVHAGTIPGYELRPDGSPADMAVYYKVVSK